MTYGHSLRVPADSAIGKAVARASGSWGGYQAWRQLDADRRLQLIEQALKPANDRIDAYPVAL